MIVNISHRILSCGSRFLATERQGTRGKLGFRLVATWVASFVESTLLVSRLAITVLSQHGQIIPWVWVPPRVM